MKPILIAVLVAGMASSASAGERFSGSQTYTATSQVWTPMPGAGYAMAKMVGSYTPQSGPIPKSRVECWGSFFWSPKKTETHGVCVFGVLPDRWMVRYRRTSPTFPGKTIGRFLRQGEWTVISGEGRFAGMTGKGTYLAKPVTTGKAPVHKTMWAGEVTIPKSQPAKK